MRKSINLILISKTKKKNQPAISKYGIFGKALCNGRRIISTGSVKIGQSPRKVLTLGK